MAGYVLNSRQRKSQKRELRFIVVPGVWEKLPGGGTFRTGSCGDYRPLRVSNGRLGPFYTVTVYSVGSKESLKSIDLGEV